VYSLTLPPGQQAKVQVQVQQQQAWARQFASNKRL
jgi:hypothetical protein